jgi:hypothetical protein
MIYLINVERAPAAKTEEPGIPSGVPGETIAYSAGTCDGTPDWTCA